MSEKLFTCRNAQLYYYWYFCGDLEVQLINQLFGCKHISFIHSFEKYVLNTRVRKTDIFLLSYGIEFKE